MSQELAKQQTGNSAAIQKGTRGEDDLSLALDGARFDQMQRIATVMARGSLLPDHLIVKPFWATPGKGAIHPQAYATARNDLGDDIFNQSLSDAERRTMANCFRVVNQAFRWRFDPFAIVDKTYSVGDGKLAYEGQLVAAVINTRAPIRSRLGYEFTGDQNTDGRTITVTGWFIDEDSPRKVSLNVGQAKTKNEIWRKDPDQKLVYSGAIKWARRYCPELMLGVVTEDDLERMQMKVIDTQGQAPAQITEAPTTADIKKKILEKEPIKEVVRNPEPDPEPEPDPKITPRSAEQTELPVDATEKTKTEAQKYLAEQISSGLPEDHATAQLKAFNLIGKTQTWKDLPIAASLATVQDAINAPDE